MVVQAWRRVPNPRDHRRSWRWSHASLPFLDRDLRRADRSLGQTATPRLQGLEQPRSASRVVSVGRHPPSSRHERLQLRTRRVFDRDRSGRVNPPHRAHLVPPQPVPSVVLGRADRRHDSRHSPAGPGSHPTEGGGGHGFTATSGRTRVKNPRGACTDSERSKPR